MTGMQIPSQFAGDARHWFTSSILAASVLEPLHELNRSWLALLAMAPHRWTMGAAASRLPDPVGAGLMGLTPEQRAEMARCPFSLFTARFNDSAYWLAVSGNRQVHEPSTDERDDAADGVAEFAELALFFAWHLVRANPSSAKIVLGMPDQTIAAFASLSAQHLATTGTPPGCADQPALATSHLVLVASAQECRSRGSGGRRAHPGSADAGGGTGNSKSTRAERAAYLRSREHVDRDVYEWRQRCEGGESAPCDHGCSLRHPVRLRAARGPRTAGRRFQSWLHAARA